VPEHEVDYCLEALTMYAWRFHALEPRVAMRSEQPLAPVEDVGLLGESVGSYLFQVKRDRPEEWATLQRTLRVLIPAVDVLDVELDERRGTLALEIRQGGISYSTRQASEGTLRVLGLLAAVTNPDARLVAFEEPENGVHPQRIELIARLLVSQAVEAPRPKQIVVTTHSPILCGALIRHAREHPGQIALLRVVQGRGGTQVKPLDIEQTAFKDDELRRQLATVDDVAVFEGLVLRGLLDD
jgi:predicted ATPase